MLFFEFSCFLTIFTHVALSWRDTNQKSSEPAQLICDWLYIILVLRDIAAANRKARPEIFERVSTAESAASDVASEDGGLETETLEDDAGEVTGEDATLSN